MNRLPGTAHYWQIVSLFVVLLAVPVSLAFVQRGVNLRLAASGQGEQIETETRDTRHSLRDVNGDGISDFLDYATEYSRNEP